MVSAAKVLHVDEYLTSCGVVGELSFPFKGRLNRQRTRFCDVYNLKVTLAVQCL